MAIDIFLIRNIDIWDDPMLGYPGILVTFNTDGFVRDPVDGSVSEESESVRFASVIIPEKQRAQFIVYLRQVADMLERS